MSLIEKVGHFAVVIGCVIWVLAWWSERVQARRRARMLKKLEAQRLRSEIRGSAGGRLVSRSEYRANSKDQ